MRLRLVYESSPGMEPTVWEKTAEELLVPNGEDSLIGWMLRTSAERNSQTFSLEVISTGVCRHCGARVKMTPDRGLAVDEEGGTYCKPGSVPNDDRVFPLHDWEEEP
ncbi:MAG TPA: hypothetical protein VIT65_10790 [Microlunatus sp.]